MGRALRWLQSFPCQAGNCRCWRESKEMQKKDLPRPLDSVQAKLIAYGIVAVFIGIITFLGVRSVSGPQLSKGDKLEVRTCRRCQGNGQEPASDKRCRGCLGSKKVKVILPGPEHPVEIGGTVRDLGAFDDLQSAQSLAQSESEPKNLTPVRGAVRQAKIRFHGASGKIELESKATGRYRGALKPGQYQVEVTAAGFQDWKQDLTIAPRTEPIWPKMPGVEESKEDQLRLHFMLKK